tara:strand:- start:562 stop:948 length:387 start_codon:yes stop_codon:yes gene_type:complete
MTDEEKEKPKENPIYWMDEFVLTGSFGSAYDFFNSIDLIVRIHSGPPSRRSWDALLANQEAFSKAITKCIMRAVYSNLDADTVDGSEWKGMAGAFPKWKGEPGFSHLIWGLEQLSKDVKEFKKQRMNE